MSGHHGDGHRHGADAPPHDHGPLEAITHVHGGAMVLDIGGSIGALHVVLDDVWAGRELFLRTVDGAGSVHTGVWRRRRSDGDVATALFAGLPEGTYTVLDRPGADRCLVEVRGGEVAEIDRRLSATVSR